MASATNARTQVETLLQLIHSSTEEAMSEYEKTGHGIPTPDSATSHPLDDKLGALALRKAIRTLEAACERLCTTLAQPMHTLVNRSMPYEAPCLKLVAEEKIADIIKASPDGTQGMHINDIAARTEKKIASDKLGQVMLLLSTRGCFREVSKNVYANNRISLALLSTHPISSTVAVLSGEILQGVSMLPEAMVHRDYALSRAGNRTGYSYLLRNEMENSSFFDWINANRFQRSMTGFNHISGSAEAVLQTPSGKDFLTFCDVGSGPGAVALSLSKHYKDKFRVTLQDLSDPLGHAKTVWSTEYPAAIVDFVPVNFLKESPVPGQDVYFLGYIVHNWPDSDTVTILKNVAKAMNDTSRLLLRTYYIPFSLADPPLLPNYGSGNVRQYNFNIVMLGVFNSSERMKEDFISLGQRSGLKLVKIWPLVETCLIEYRLARDDTRGE
ncbi:S-adenosyl-L-methionine-dependent methyltransferase [Marasmius fiardii PR-910]|nr:S-adenosyl-L-methionine-dependent methyltransferase [Marasmius fiardii PR-910]